MSNWARIREDAKRLNPIDDALFIVMSEELDFCQEILSVFLSDSALRVVCHTPRKIMKNLQGRSCTLDLYCTQWCGHIKKKGFLKNVINAR